MSKYYNATYEIYHCISCGSFKVFTWSVFTRHDGNKYINYWITNSTEKYDWFHVKRHSSN